MPTAKIDTGTSKIDTGFRNGRIFSRKSLWALPAVYSVLYLGMSGAAAEEVNAGFTLEEIVVTAQKRQQNLNEVAMSITALSGTQLKDKRIETAADLVNVVPGFTYTETQFEAPVYSLRGIGYVESSLAAGPTVSVYVDEVPLPYPTMTRGAILDLERVEVLKGPQGTLFGQNSTGGAINYIAAKPTEEFEAGVDASFGRFNTINASGFLSGALTDKVLARAAVKTIQSDDWQKSTTRDDGHGEKDFLSGRILVDLLPSDNLKISLNFNGWRDKSDTQAPQLSSLARFDGGNFVSGLDDARIINAPLVSDDARAADWNPEQDFVRDNSFYQVSARIEWDVAEDISVTSISSYQRFDRDSLQDADATTATDLHVGTGGHVSSFTQELRVSGDTVNNIRWMLGANYENDRVEDRQDIFLGDSVGSRVGPFQFLEVNNFSDQDIENWAVFANLEWQISEAFSLEGGMRYTEHKIDFAGCSLDSGAGDLSGIFAFIQSLVPLPTTAPLAGECITLLPDFNTGVVTDEQKQDNLSWRIGLNWKPTDDALIYANVSQGYKAGSFPTLSASSFAQLAPVVQEELLAYEAGFKVSLADRTAQINGAIFYYDYTNKQFGGRLLDPIFGSLSNLVNIPESEVYGAEIQVLWAPVDGLTVGTTATYIETEIGAFSDFNQFGQQQAFDGNEFPYSPKWQITSDFEYTWDLNESLSGFVGADLSYHSKTKGGLTNDPRLTIDDYVLVNLRVGIEDAGGLWKLSLWGKNITNTYYWTNALHTQDTVLRYAALPATYGIAVSYNF